jgi:LAS superfamily LD-carboxypeptidase LdcB
MPDDQPQINQDVINSLIPVTGQQEGAQQAAPPIRFDDLSQLLGNQQPKTQQQQTVQGQAATNFDSKTQASLDSLQPDFGDRAKQWIQGMRDAGYNPMLHFGYRSPDEQQQLYQKYLAGGNKAVAPPMSYHTYGRAFDWVNQGQNGDLEWNNDKAYQVGQALAKNYGLTGIGAGDNDHIQDANYKSWRDLPKSEYGNVQQRQVAQQLTQR